MGALVDPVANLAAMFAANTGFNAWLGLSTPNATEAASRIYLDGIGPENVDAETMTRDELEALRPFLVLYPDGNRGYRFTRDGMPNCWNANGNILAVLSRPYDSALSISQHWTAAAALLEPIIDNTGANTPGLLQQASTAGFLAFRDLAVIFAGRTPPEHRLDYGDAYDVVLIFEY